MAGAGAREGFKDAATWEQKKRGTELLTKGTNQLALFLKQCPRTIDE